MASVFQNGRHGIMVPNVFYHFCFVISQNKRKTGYNKLSLSYR